MSKSKLHHNELGVAILEFSLIAGVFFATLLSIMDLSRFFAAQALLTKGAQNGLAVAKTDPDFGIDIQRLNIECTVNGILDTACRTTRLEAFRAARDRVIARATELPLATFVSAPTGNGTVKLRTVSNLDNVLLGPLGLDADNLALVLRPGDVANVTTADTVPVTYSEFHPQICPPGNRTAGSSYLSLCKAAADPTVANSVRLRNANETMGMLFENFPIVVKLTAEIDMFMPLFPKMTVTGTAIGYREVVNRSRVGNIPDQLACPITAADCKCGSDFEVVNSNCECVPKTVNPAAPNNPCRKAGGAATNYDFDTFNPTTCSCDCSVPEDKRTDSNNPTSQCQQLAKGGPNSDGKGYYRPTSGQTGGAAIALWNDSICSCECNPAACPSGMEIPLAEGRVAVLTGGTDASGFCTCGCGFDSSDPRNGGRGPCPGGMSFLAGRCECSCYGNNPNREQCAIAISQGAQVVFNEALCQCECKRDSGGQLVDPSCQPPSCTTSAQVTLAKQCQSQGRVFDYSTCQCSSNCVQNATPACTSPKVKTFNGSSCDCQCPTSPQSCGTGQYWNPTTCSCQACNITCGPLQAIDPATCTCITSGGG